MEKVSELQMADAFEILINSKNGIKGLPNFKSAFREVTCKQGVADFIAICGNDLEELSNCLYDSDAISLDSSSLVMSLLKSRAPRTEDFLVSATGLTRVTVKKVIKVLEDSGAICSTKTGGFILSPNWGIPTFEIWAFELKLKDWKRALFQVLQYKAFANRVVIVLPADKESIILKNIDVFKNLKVGVMTFNMHDSSYKIIVKPYKISPSSRRHNLFALGKIAMGLKRDLE